LVDVTDPSTANQSPIRAEISISTGHIVSNDNLTRDPPFRREDVEGIVVGGVRGIGPYHFWAEEDNGEYDQVHEGGDELDERGPDLRRGDASCWLPFLKSCLGLGGDLVDGVGCAPVGGESRYR
jgi:hypothetical protein